MLLNDEVSSVTHNNGRKAHLVSRNLSLGHGIVHADLIYYLLSQVSGLIWSSSSEEPQKD